MNCSEFGTGTVRLVHRRDDEDATDADASLSDCRYHAHQDHFRTLYLVEKSS